MLWDAASRQNPSTRTKRGVSGYFCSLIDCVGPYSVDVLDFDLENVLEGGEARDALVHIVQLYGLYSTEKVYASKIHSLAEGKVGL